MYLYTFSEPIKCHYGLEIIVTRCFQLSINTNLGEDGFIGDCEPYSYSLHRIGTQFSIVWKEYYFTWASTTVDTFLGTARDSVFNRKHATRLQHAPLHYIDGFAIRKMTI